LSPATDDSALSVATDCTGTVDHRTGTEAPAASTKRKALRLLKVEFPKPDVTLRFLIDESAPPCFRMGGQEGLHSIRIRLSSPWALRCPSAFSAASRARPRCPHAVVPGGQITESHVQPPLQKYFGVLFTQITSLSVAIPHPQEGRIAIVTDVGRGMRWTQAAR
jgi:hypothetical protein